MITELSAEQKARVPEFIEKWTRIRLCTDPANRPEAEEGARFAYRLAGLKPPSKIVWCGSPFAMGLARRRHTRSVSRKSAISVRDLVSGSVSTLVWYLVRDSVSAAVRDSVSAAVWASVANSVSSSVTAAVRASVRNWSSVRSIQHSWCSYYDYFRVVCGLIEQTEKMLGLAQVAENADWWLPCKDICWISERPNRLKFDDRGRLHCEDGPALSYPDGWSVYAIHGVLVDEQVIMHPRSQDVGKIRKESNAEVKRVRIERFGWGEYLRAVGAVVIDTRHNDVEATKEALMRSPDGHVVLVCACPSTSRVYCLEVPPTIATCERAQDWLSGGLAQRVINGA